jgi:AcrR family transcriptional regulator
MVMRKTRDGESTKKIVIHTARQVFAEHGFEGTSLAMISQKCGISDGLILHHYKSKSNLYQAVLEELAREYFETISATRKEMAEPDQVMVNMLRTTFQYWSEDTAYQRISLWSFLENRTGLVEEEIKLTENLAAAIQSMQSAGKVDPGYSPFVLLAMAIGPIQFWTQHRALFQESLHLGQSMEELNQDFLNQYLGLIRKLYQAG